MRAHQQVLLLVDKPLFDKSLVDKSLVMNMFFVSSVTLAI